MAEPDAPSPARGRPERRVLEGRFVRLEPIGPQYAAGLYAATSGEGQAERYRWLSVPPPEDEAALAGRLATMALSEDPLHFAVIDRASGRCGGRQALMRIKPNHGVIEIGSVLWGRGIARTRLATDAVYLMARHVFDELGYRRFEWKCDARNDASKHAARRFGFSFEGIFRQHMIIKGENRDTAWFSMLDREWPTIRAGYERWLAPGNFDEIGQQREKLRF